jgi:hypothetical protein
VTGIAAIHQYAVLGHGFRDSWIIEDACQFLVGIKVVFTQFRDMPDSGNQIELLN